MNNLNGKIENNLHNLRGINKTEKKQPYFISKLKTQILDELMIPLINTNWSHINNNFFLFNKLKEKIDEYYLKYKFDDLIFYRDIIDIIEIVLNEHNQLFDLEKEKYSTNNSNSLIYKTKIIRLKAEYEIYNLIYGKPKKSEIYDNLKLENIKKLLKQNNITFDIIKKKLQEI